MIETERLVLRKITTDDGDEIAEIMRSKGVQAVWGHYFTDKDVDNWIERRLAGYEKNGIDYLLAVRKSDGKVVGQMGVLRETIEDREVWGVGYILKDEFQGIGYATEGARASVNYAFDVLKTDKIVCDIRPENKGSIAVAERLGLKRTGQFVKHYHGMDMVHIIFEGKKGEVL